MFKKPNGVYVLLLEREKSSLTEPEENWCTGWKQGAHLLFGLQEADQVVRVQVVFVVAVGEHEEVQVPARRHHLVEGAELFKVQRALVVICVRLLPVTKTWL